MKIICLIMSLLILFACGAEDKIIINFNEEIYLNSQLEFIKDLSSLNLTNNSELRDLLDNQDWIKQYLVKNYPLNATMLVIQSRKPILNWEKIYLIDDNLRVFHAAGNDLLLPKIDASFDKVAEWILWHESFLDISKKYQFLLQEIKFVYGGGWEISSDRSVIKIGNKINEEVIQKYQEALNYVFRMNLNPSIIDLRNINGIALSHGK